MTLVVVVVVVVLAAMTPVFFATECAGVRTTILDGAAPGGTAAEFFLGGILFLSNGC